MNSFRRFSRRAWLLHGYLLASMILWPVPTVRSYWTWDTATNAKVEIENPPVGDSWWDFDSDGDGMTNAQEVAFLSDPYNRDSDHDGLTDTDERDITPAMLGGLITTDPWNWYSNGNGHSDHDEYWAWQSGLALNVNYYGQTPPSPLPPDYYRDLDGDGTYNLWDYAPTDSGVTSPPADPGSGGTGTPPDPSTTDSDGDTHYDSSDSHPSLNYLWEDWNWNGTNDSQEPPPPSDSDGDTHYDTSDSHPYNPSLWEDWNWNGTNDSQEAPPSYPSDPTSPPDPYYTDSDGDSAIDANDSDPTDSSLWEDWNRNGTNDSSEPPDSDGDGVTDADEYTAGTTPFFHDSDGDGLSDSEERTAQTNPLLVDTDADGLTDHEEIFIYQKNPLFSRSLPGQQQIDYYQVNLADTDLDGIPDLVEAWYGRDPASDADAASDLDVDGHSDLDAYLAGWAFTVSFTSYDQDRDGITDARESYWGFNPYDPDDATQDADHDGLLNIEEIRLGLDPLSATTHGTPDLTYANTTWSLGWKACLNPGSSATTLDDDTDGDGMPDHWEHRHRLDLRDARDAIRDPDKDTLSNLTEYRFLSHPRIPKSESNTHDRTRLYATGSPLNGATTGGLMNRYRAQMAADLQGENVFKNFSFTDIKLPDGGNDNGGDNNANCDCGLPDCPECDGTGSAQCQTCMGSGTVGSCPNNHTKPCPTTEPGYCSGHGYKAHESGHNPFNCPQTKENVKSRTCTILEHEHQSSCYAECPEEVHSHADSECELDDEGQYTCGKSEHGHGPGCEYLECGFTEEHTHTDAEGDCYGYKDHVHSADTCGHGVAQPCDYGSGGSGACPGVAVPCPEDEDGGTCPQKAPQECSKCNGTGSPLVSAPCDGSCGYPMTCSTCDGGGSVTCQRCDGSGGAGAGTGNPNSCGKEDCPCDGVPKNQCPHNEDGGAPIKFIPPSVSASDGSGSRYRKIGLNGLPHPDSKPQSQDESGENPEETYIDAYTGHLRHSVSDVYVKADGSELPLMVRRDTAGDVSSAQHGLAVGEKPNLPFGPGWSSNLCAYIKLEGLDLTDSSRATVVDEQGSSQTFVRNMTLSGGIGGVHWKPEGNWQPDGSASYDTRARNNQLVPLAGSGFMLLKKFGTTCFYENAGIIQEISSDRANGSDDRSSSYYQRLVEVRDRLGNRLRYQYPGTGTLIPSRIYDPERPGLQIQVVQAEGRVQVVRQPHGEEVHYFYTGSDHQLTSVQRGDSVSRYTYELTLEDYSPPLILPPPEQPDESTHLPRYHTNLASIEDELGNLYSFTYDYDRSVESTVMDESSITQSVQQGSPRIVVEVFSPAGRVSFSRVKSVQSTATSFGVNDAVFHPVSVAVDAVDGSRTTYLFTAPHIHSYSDKPAELSYVGTFTFMQVKRIPPSGSPLAESLESYTFDKLANMALASATDISGNTTSFTYAAGHDDPLTETAILQSPSGPVHVTKHFTYDDATRIMTSMTDPMGVKTEYTIDNTRTITRDGMTIPVLGLKMAEKVRDASNTVLRETRYTYRHPVFAGLATKQWTISSNQDVMPSSVTTTTLGDPGTEGFSGGWYEDTSRAWILTDQGTTAPAYRCGWWREVTTTTGPATPEGDLVSDPSPSALSSTLSIADLGGKKRQVIDARSFATSFDYDDSGRLTRVDHPDQSFKTLDFDAHGNLIAETNENGVTTFHAYDDLNRRVKTTFDLNGNGLPDPNYTVPNSSPPTPNSPPDYDGDLVTTTVYNNRNQVLSQIDPRGNDVTHVYDALGRLITTSKAGLTTTFTYDGNNGGSIFDTSAIKPNRTTDPRGVGTTIVYDSLYRPISSTVTDPGLNGGPVFTAVSLHEYDLNGRPVKVTDPLNRITLNEYDALGNLTKVTEPDLTTDTSDNPTVQSYYTHHGKPWKVIDQMGNETVTTYDALGRAVQVKAPRVNGQGGQVQAITTTEYDAAGNVIAVTDPLGRVVETLYDERNRPTHVYAPTMWDAVIGQFVRPYAVTTYDALGQPLSVTDHTGATTTSHYDRAGRKWKVEAPAVEGGIAFPPNTLVRPTTLTTFDPGGLSLTVTNPLNQTITNTYDVHGRLKTTLDAEGILNEFDYDAAGNRTLVKDGLNQQTTFKYDGLNRLIEQRFADGDTWTHTYNAVRKESQLSPRGIVTSYGYDARDRLLTVTASGTEGGIAFPPTSRSYTYDNAGKLKTVTESTVAAGVSTPKAALAVSYTYDEMGRVTAESSHGQTHWYEYDLAGNRVKATYSTGRIVETSYDGLNRPEAIVDGDRLTRYGYDKAGRAVILVAANGQTSQNTYDALGRLTDRTLFKTPAMSEANVSAEFSWEHDLLGNVTKQGEAWPGETTRAGELRRTTMGYDDNNRLTTETIATITSSGEDTVTTAYTYDNANNRKTKTVTGGTEPGHWDYTYNVANQLTAWDHLDYPGGSVLRSASLTYDDAGNRTSQTVQEQGTPNQEPRTTAYTWDAQDRLASVTLPDGSEHRYAYDYRTRRISTGVRTPSSANETKTETKTSIVFSGGLSVAEWEQESGTGLQPVLSAPPTVEYTRGPDMGGGVGGLLYTSRAAESSSSSYSASSSRTVKYNLSNGRGDIVAQSDAYASLTWTASYEAYGKRTKETGENKDKQRGNSKDEDPTGLLNEGFRYRDIETGVWLSRDPAGFVDGPNVYAYVQQNPWTNFDPDGLEAVPAPGGGYMFKSNEDPANYIGKQVQHPNAGYNGQCATGAQHTCGTVKKNGKVYDAPSTNSSSGGGPWRKGQSLRDYTPPKGTMIAWGFDKDGKYPSTPAGNHTAMYEGPVDNKGNFNAISQNRRTTDSARPSPFSRDQENVNRNDWFVVVADKPHDPRPSQSSLVQMPDDPKYPNLDRPQGGAESPTGSAKPKKSFGQKVKDVFGNIFKKKEKK